MAKQNFTGVQTTIQNSQDSEQDGEVKIHLPQDYNDDVSPMKNVTFDPNLKVSRSFVRQMPTQIEQSNRERVNQLNHMKIAELHRSKTMQDETFLSDI